MPRPCTAKLVALKYRFAGEPVGIDWVEPVAEDDTYDKYRKMINELPKQAKHRELCYSVAVCRW